MPIILKTIRIAGFRAHRAIELDLNAQTVLIGTNNVGKTTILNALQLAMGDGRFGISPDDFHLQQGEALSEILIDLLFYPTDNHGKIAEDFDSIWTAALGKGIQEGGEGQFFAFRTRVSAEEKDRSFAPSRNILNQWLPWDDSGTWQSERIEGDAFRVSAISKCMPLYFQNAQRDILDDIRQRSSYLGKALSKISYDSADKEALQELIQEVNDKAVQSSPILKSLKSNLSQLGNTFGTSQGAADITPFAKNIRDLTKSVRLHFHDGTENLSMEYHGMGTRSWSSLLILKAFVEIVAAESQQSQIAFYPILALEEPEAHLHPNAQKQIMGQIQGFPGQILVSTHSPFLVAQCDLKDCRLLQRQQRNTACSRVITDWSPEEHRKIRSHVINSHGELLFSRAVVLCEGETEEQLLPAWVSAYTGRAPFEFGISIVGVGGYGNLQIFTRLFYELGIPVFVFADNDGAVKSEIAQHLTKIAGPNHATIIQQVYLDSGNDLEAQLLSEGYQDQLKEAIYGHLLPTYSNARHAAVKRAEIMAMDDASLLAELRSLKSQYSAKLGELFLEAADSSSGALSLPRHFLALAQLLGLQPRVTP